jgi:hypothetical protein
MISPRLQLRVGQGIMQGRPLVGCDGHCTAPGTGLLSEAGGWVAECGEERGLDVPIALIVCSEVAAEFEFA